jgi:RecA-family ATPase
VVIDSLSRFWNVMDENNNMEVIREVSPLLEMARETNAAVLLVHHERKSGGEDGRSIRGGSALFGLVDQAIFLERRQGEASNKRTLKTLGRYEESPPELFGSTSKGENTGRAPASPTRQPTAKS